MGSSSPREVSGPASQRPGGVGKAADTAVQGTAVVAAKRSRRSGEAADVAVEVRRSQRRRRTVSAYRDGERVVVLIPDRFSRAEENEWVDRMLARLANRQARLRRSDADLLARARRLAERYLHEYPIAVASVRWVSNQHSRWGSCTPDDRTIRISDRVRGMPEWVLDYVVLHELVHLVVPTHGPSFWALVARYPKAERARGYLEGVAAATQ